MRTGPYTALLIDLDSQASASLSLGIERADFKPSFADVILEGRGMSGTIRKTAVEGLDLITGSPDLADADLQLAKIPGRERRLKEAIAPIRAAYDFIVLDCPPSLGLLAVNSMVAADAFIIPTTPEYLALEGLVGLMTAARPALTLIFSCRMKSEGKEGCHEIKTSRLARWTSWTAYVLKSGRRRRPGSSGPKSSGRWSPGLWGPGWTCPASGRKKTSPPPSRKG